jgi:hypothetical protein
MSGAPKEVRGLLSRESVTSLSGAFAKYGVSSPGRRTSGKHEVVDACDGAPRQTDACGHSSRPWPPRPLPQSAARSQSACL